MATHTSIYFENTKLEIVEEALRAFFNEVFPSKELISTSSAQLPIYGDLFHFGEFPTAFSYAACPEGWCTAHFNCFSRLSDFAQLQSQLLATRIVVLNIQSNSSCYYIGVHEFGSLRRAIAYEDGEWTLQYGEPYPFERDSPLTDVIRETDIERFCREFDLRITGRDCFPEKWCHIQLVDQPEKRKYEAIARPIPWWKRLLRRVAGI